MLVEINKDSVNEFGNRITTFVLEYPRFIHSQVMTHRVFSRSASSSRAVPVKKIIDRVENDPVRPVHWGKNQRGMVADSEISIELVSEAEKVWQEALMAAVESARKLADLGVHKQVVNRVLEPFSWISVVLTATEFDNFYALRLGHDAQPEIQALARAMRDAHDASEPVHRAFGEWHLPFTSEEEAELITVGQAHSVARCARVSYNNHVTGERSNYEQDAKLAESLRVDGHMSPFEHQAVAMDSDKRFFNLRGWASNRFFIELNKDFPVRQ